MSEDAAPATPLLRVVRGNPSPEEVAALVAVVSAYAAGPTGAAPEPVLSEWAYDAGIGLDLDGLAIYAATPVTGGWSPRITLRLQRRF